MKPYYDDGQIAIYHGDCRELLPSLEPVGLVLADPPYGIGGGTEFNLRDHDPGRNGRGNATDAVVYPKMVGDDCPFEPTAILALNVPTILWGANYYAKSLPETSGWLVWDKRCGRFQNDQADGELAWTNCIKGVRIFAHQWTGFLRDSERGENYHPTQKPVALFRWCLGLPWIPEGIILDPYMGSGPILRAAKDLGRRAIGIEIEERYCEIAANRLMQTVLPFAKEVVNASESASL
jgi:site-specific DNA-methyltransferase (adenine-specific)